MLLEFSLKYRPKGCFYEKAYHILAQGLFLLKMMCYREVLKMLAFKIKNVRYFSKMLAFKIIDQLLKDMCHYFEMNSILFLLLKVQLLNNCAQLRIKAQWHMKVRQKVLKANTYLVNFLFA